MSERGGTQAVGNKMILPACGQGEGGARKAMYASWAGLGFLAGRFCGQAGKSKEWTNGPHTVRSVPRLLLSCSQRGRRDG